ncbi:hypothetical protein PRZ48_000542 [Zasmidium cellare]|uniref:Exonuclease domain-containing protein n=1 Tax=Zasmidium cellare TaxID=395010 RepID=A0ABR0EYT1_ZASCE|nr:hypothetical protein PRZ48_000542 [Zasmidium cellare]
MVFSTTNLFKGIPCPEGGKCVLTNCIYAHEPKHETATDAQKAAISPTPNTIEPTAGEPAAKRRKVTYESLADKPPSRADLIRSQLASTRSTSPETPKRVNEPKSEPSKQSPQQPQSLVKPVSPPPTSGKSASSASTAARAQTNSNQQKREANGVSKQPAEKVETLNPRLIPNDPAGHQKRSLYIKHLHAEMVRLNRQVSETAGLELRHLLVLTEQKLIKLALDEEEKTARDHPTLYGNMIKSRIAALKKMPQEEWIKHVKSTYTTEQPKPSKRAAKALQTGLPIEQEHLILPELVIDQKPLAAHGYIPIPPTEAEAAEAAAAVEASKNYEICDRCAGRFQVFPDRNEDGLLTSAGTCTFHLLRKVFPQRSKTDKETGEKEPYYPCCNEPMGTRGCTTRDEHVFKTTSPGRLAAIMPFINTPENDSPAKDRRGKDIEGVTFDCEMGYTALGLELIRLTAVSWPLGEELLDILVRPLGAIIDLNSRFSGVFAEHFANAIPYDEWQQPSPTPSSDPTAEKPLPVVDGPHRARELLCSFLTPKTPLIGHAIENDLNTVRLCHPTVIDTMILYPHPKGLPMRFGLKMLTQRYLHRQIQTGGDRGHDSLEDAIATGDLVRAKVGDKWRTLRSSGWQIINDKLIPPPFKQSDEASAAVSETNAKDLAERAAYGASKKRKKRADSDSSEHSGGQKGAGTPQAAAIETTGDDESVIPSDDKATNRP